jgi:plastocyanin
MAIIDIIRNNEGTVIFSPSPLEVAHGDTVIWRNLDSAKHWITRKGKPENFWFPSPLARCQEGVPPDTSAELIAESAGSVDYFCSLSPQLKGTITIRGG